MIKSRKVNKEAKPAKAADKIKAQPAPAARSRPKKTAGLAEPQIVRVGLYNIKPPKGTRKKKKLLGRGSSSGHGKTSTRGSKGQTSRAGRHFYLGFEGGQSPLIRKMPKRGFTSRSKKDWQIVNLESLKRIKEVNITPEVLHQGGLIKDKHGLVKILGNGQIQSAVNVQAHAFSKRAMEQIKGLGGKAEVLNAQRPS